MLVCLFAYNSKTYEWISMKFSGKIEDGTRRNKPLNFGSDLWPWQKFVFVCQLAYYSKTYEWISMKFLGKIEVGTSNEPLNFVSELGLGRGLRSSSTFSERRFALSECF